jgi:sortase A
MTARLLWSPLHAGIDAPRRRRRRRRLRGLEWVFLLFGLAALDSYLWISTSTVLYQAYEDWSFDETMRGLKPSVRGFAADEIYWLFGGDRMRAEKSVTPRQFEPLPSPRALLPDSLIGRLRIPRLRVEAMVREGADSGTLRRAVGHIPGTALPGAAGNVALAGHRDTFFRELRNIKRDDTIDFETERGTYRYVVASTSIVGPRDTSVLAAAKRQQTLTLVTCYPFYYVGSAPKRFVVRAIELPRAAGRQVSTSGRATSGLTPPRPPPDS